MVDNFSMAAENLLKFGGDGEFYMMLVLRRRKDFKGDMAEGVNEDNRLIKHYFIYDSEYLERKRQSVVALCNQNDARAYILPQRRDCRLVLWALHDKVSDTLRRGSMNVHFDHLIRSCVAGMHETTDRRYKRWVLDLDIDSVECAASAAEWLSRTHPDENFWSDCDLSHFALHLVERLRETLVTTWGRSPAATAFMPNVGDGYGEGDVTLLPTPHGFHIVTPPFNREPSAMRDYFGVQIPASVIKPDAMALVYAPNVAKPL